MTARFESKRLQFASSHIMALTQCAKNSPVWRRDVVDCAANPRNVFCLLHWGWGNAAMDMTLRDLTADELERVVGGDAHLGEGICTAPQLIFKVANVTVLVAFDACDYL